MRKLRIVVVEDEYYVRRGIIDAFDWDSLGCVIVGEATNGRDGIKVIEDKMPDLVIADIEMPVMNGIEMVKHLNCKNLSIEYIFLTAHRNFDYVHSALKMEVSDYILKPFQYDDLDKAIKSAKLRVFGDRDNEGLNSRIDNIEVDNAYVKNAIEYVRKNYSKEISNITISEHLNINSSYFCRLFKKETGFTFVQYLINYRIRVATRLLSNFDMRISEVAEQVGFSDSNYFSNTFKKITGSSPKAYQKEHKY